MDSGPERLETRDKWSETGEVGEGGIEGSDCCDGGPVIIDRGEGGSGRSGVVGREYSPGGGVGGLELGLDCKPG